MFKVFSGVKELQEVVTILWSFKILWGFAYKNANLAPWIAQFAFGMYNFNHYRFCYNATI